MFKMHTMLPKPMNLLAPNGILRVRFVSALNDYQSLVLVAVTQIASSVEELEEKVIALGAAWGIVTATEVIGCADRD